LLDATRAFVALRTRLVVCAVAATRDGETFDAFLARHHELRDKEFALTFYTEARLRSDRARAEWVKPDLRPLPCGVAVFADTAR
jgi:hypothetical protein